MQQGVGLGSGSLTLYPEEHPALARTLNPAPEPAAEPAPGHRAGETVAFQRQYTPLLHPLTTPPYYTPLLHPLGETVAFQRQSPDTGLPRHVDPCSWVTACHI